MSENVQRMSRDDWALPLPMKPVSTFISRRKQKLRKHLDIRCGRWLETTAQSVVGDTWEIPGRYQRRCTHLGLKSTMIDGKDGRIAII